MIKADFHTHCNFSTDSKATPESMLEGAIKKGLTHLCLTDHMDLDYPGTTEEKPLFEFDPFRYFCLLSPLKENYPELIAKANSLHCSLYPDSVPRERFHLSIGVELGLRPNRPDLNKRMHQLLSDYPFDFVLGSVHLLGNEDPYYEEYWQTHAVSPKEILRTYFNDMLASLKGYDNFDSLGHLDYLIRYIPASLGAKDYVYGEFKEVLDEILKILIRKDKALEINTAGLVKGLSCFHPKAEIVTRYLELGGKLLTIGSDGHSPEMIAAEFQKTEEMLAALGVKGYYVYRNRKPEFMAF